MNYKDWVETVPKTIRDDPVWRVEAYRLALFAGDLAWQDATKLLSDKRTISISDQLNRSAGAISGDIAEGFSRRSGKDQARFYEYGLGSAREARDWYYKARHILGMEVIEHRMELLTQIIKSLLVIIPNERGWKIQEGNISDSAQTIASIDGFTQESTTPNDESGHAPRITYHPP